MNTLFCNRIITRGRRALLAFPLLTVAVVAAEEATPEKTKTLPAPILRKYDADRDGRLSETERAAWKEDVQRGRAEAQARRLERFDANHDGKLDKAEKAEAAKAGNGKSDGAKGASGKSDSAKTGMDKADTAKTGGGRSDPAQAGMAKADGARAGTGKSGLVKAPASGSASSFDGEP